MPIDYIIVGQGIAGTWLSFFLWQNNKTFIVFDNQKTNSGSRISAGIINPVSGPRYVTDNAIHYNHIEQLYRDYENYFNIKVIKKTSIVDFFETKQKQENFFKKIPVQNNIMQPCTLDYSALFNYQHGAGVIQPCYQVNVHLFLQSMKDVLIQDNKYIQDTFIYEDIEHGANTITYKNIRAKKIIFCDGAANEQNPYLKHLHFANTKGEVLLAKIEHLPTDVIYKHQHMLVPMYKNIFWIGASNTWHFEHDIKSETFLQETKKWLTSFLKIPYTIINHKAAIRPTLSSRKPIASVHPIYNNMAILNGMGTKACTYAPLFAKQLATQWV